MYALMYEFMLNLNINTVNITTTLLFMKSHAKSFNDFNVKTLAATVTISRIFPNWNKNVISGPAIIYVLI